jgi:hypothetical protein
MVGDSHATSFGEGILIKASESNNEQVTIRKDVVAGQTIHLILEATDNGTPALTRYQRVIIRVRD